MRELIFLVLSIFQNEPKRLITFYKVGEIMKLVYDSIIIRKRKLVNEGSICIADVGVNLLKGENGVGKTLFFKKIYNSNEINMVLVAQDNRRALNKRKYNNEQ